MDVKKRWTRRARLDARGRGTHGHEADGRDAAGIAEDRGGAAERGREHLVRRGGFARRGRLPRVVVVDAGENLEIIANSDEVAERAWRGGRLKIPFQNF